MHLGMYVPAYMDVGARRAGLSISETADHTPHL